MATKEEPDRAQEIYETVAEYSNYSTVAGLTYVFMNNVPLVGKIIWALCVISMLCFGAVWSVRLYIEWQEKPVLTTVTTTALPISEVQFPAVVICSEGYDFDTFDAALVKLFFDFVKNNGGPTATVSPLMAAMAKNKNILDDQTPNETEKKALEEFNQLHQQYWEKFMKTSFPGLPQEYIGDISDFDWLLVMHNQKDPNLYLGGYGVQVTCENDTSQSCLETILTPSEYEDEESDDDLQSTLSSIDFTDAFQAAFSVLWRSKLPCFDTNGMSGFQNGERGILKRCKWKNMQINCSAIFTTFPTDQGMCCAFNMKAADKIFADSQYLASLTQLQAEDLSLSFENTSLSDSYTKRNEHKSQAGRNMGLEVILDAHSNLVESFSVSRDFEGFTGLITDSSSFPLTNQRGFEIRPGHNNLVAISAIQISANEDLKILKPEVRKCLYENERGNLTLFRNYSQSNCFLECSLKYAQRNPGAIENFSQGCTPWFFPFTDDTFKMCDPYSKSNILENMQNIPNDECNYCLPDCIRTIYDQRVTTQPFRRCDERNLELTDFCTIEEDLWISPQSWAQPVLDHYKANGGKVPLYLSKLVSSTRTIKDSRVLNNFLPGLSKDYDAYQKDIAVLKVFFDSPTLMQFESQPRQTWIDYFAAVGGALGLCIGLSAMTLMELVFLSLRLGGFCILRTRQSRAGN